MKRKKVRTLKVPFKGLWEREEYLSSRRALEIYNQSGAPISVGILCSFCPRHINENEIHVVDYGQRVACQFCYKARFMRLPQKFKHIPIPPDLLPPPVEITKDQIVIPVDKPVENSDRGREALKAFDECSALKKD